MAYIPTRKATESMKAYKRRITELLLRLECNARSSPALRIVQKHPDVTWKKVWKNLHTTGLTDTVTSEWYAAIHDIIPTGHRLVAINLAQNATGVQCGESDTLSHRITRCNEGPVIWTWTKVRMAATLRVSRSNIPEERALLPTYKFRPSQKHKAITWILAQLVYYQLQTQHKQSLQDYRNYLRKARWKV
jgi:hypothetical protein